MGPALINLTEWEERDDTRWGLVVVTLALAACASPNWTKPELTMAEFERDARECDREANRLARAEGAPGHQPWSRRQWPQHGLRTGHAAHEEKYEECMVRKGYAPAE